MDEMTDPAGRAAWRRRHEAIRAEVAEEEAEAIEAEIAEKAAVLEVPLHLRIDRELDIQLRQRAAEAQIPLPRWFGACSGRRSTGPRARGHTVSEIEEIARKLLDDLGDGHSGGDHLDDACQRDQGAADAGNATP